MDFEKVKEFILEKKQYFIIGVVVLGLIFFFKKEDTKQNENASLLPEKTEQSSSSSFSTSNQSSSAQSVSQSKTVTCDISGAVKHQGVYTLKNGARIQELIEAAGGAKQNAQLKAVNRAVMLKDQDKIHIPYKGEKVENASNSSSTGAGTTTTNESTSSESGQNNGEKVNLNTASAADLQKLNGIGQKKAEQIIAYREQNGQFKKIEDLMQVSGIGEKTFAALKDQLAL
ncbi:helix-hairpin-helix domain-containing protein [Lactobacillus intestinalis]|uniref:ComEA family DNA-binding protein n=2 Tax=Lactobacillus intestinalis TaxID=151781 RepID=A0A4S2BTU8_9LACO|nr:helix-hairpin-helix domain-containing protein [Lactobacillus intestinalis]KRM34000.1 competence protein ComEA [Lactobacillus intestinalis DSM 6629]TGY17755.1 ComEA family DNA-binding protein [Lactobacillus intestinalis]UTW39739.1 helix-hairpin-helix domain-containing protein [Lactobacillus intestinalis]